MVNNFEVKLHRTARKDKEKVKSVPALKKKADELIGILRQDPFKTPPAYKTLEGDLKGQYSRRLNRKHRLVYSVDKDKKVVVINSMWSHYGD